MLRVFWGKEELKRKKKILTTTKAEGEKKKKKEIVWGGFTTLSDIHVGIGKKGVRKKLHFYLMQSMVNYNGYCIGSDIRCLTNIHKSSIIQTEFYSPAWCPAVEKKQGMCAKSPDVWWSCTTRRTKEGDYYLFDFIYSDSEFSSSAGFMDFLWFIYF